MRRVLPLLLIALTPRLAAAHGGNPAQAVVLEPGSIGPPVDDAFLIKWLDAGPPPPVTGTAYVSLYYTKDIPITFPLGIMAPTLTGTVILSGVPEDQGPDEFLWDVSNMPSGHYWIWSLVDDPPMEMSAQYVRFSPAPLTVLHGNDVIGPAMTILKPQSEFSTADEFYTVDYQSWDPTGTARIRFEASPDAFRMEPMWFVIADNIYAQPAGTIGWNTSVLEEGDYMLRATITDCDGRSFVTYSRYFLFVAHLDPPDAGPLEGGEEPDGGSLIEWCSQLPDDSGVLPSPEAGTRDTGVEPGIDAGAVVEPTEDPGCGCSTTATRGSPLWAGLLGALAFARRRRRRRSRRHPPQ